MNKCLGCGAILQSEDASLEGYVKIHLEEKKLCERCFRIQNYNDYQIVLKDNTEFLEIIKKINQTKDLVLFVADPFFLNENFDLLKNNLENPILLVLTKRDVLPKSLYEEKLIKYMEKYKIPFVDSIVISSKKNYNFDSLMEKIKKYQTSPYVYVVGFTNAGKSTLINRFIYNYSSIKSTITTSILPSTTLNSIEIPLNEELTLIDTPGLIEDKSYLSILSGQQLKKVIPQKEIHPKNFQIKGKQYFKIDEFAFISACDNNILFYFSDSLKIERFYKEPKDFYNYEDYEQKKFLISKKCDLVITGLGFLKILHPGEITIMTNKNVKIYVRDSFL